MGDEGRMPRRNPAAHPLWNKGHSVSMVTMRLADCALLFTLIFEISSAITAPRWAADRPEMTNSGTGNGVDGSGERVCKPRAPRPVGTARVRLAMAHKAYCASRFGSLVVIDAAGGLMGRGALVSSRSQTTARRSSRSPSVSAARTDRFVVVGVRVEILVFSVVLVVVLTS